MAGSHSARTALREATASAHDRVDRLFSPLDPADRHDYGRFLRAQAAAHLPTETALTRDGAGAVIPDWAERRRGDLLRADLAALDLAAPDARPADLAFTSEAALLGGVYVLEGSRLGGAMLRRSVPDAFPATFLGVQDSAAWRRLLALIEERLDTEAARQIAIKAAHDVFMLFEQAGTQELKVERVGG